MRILFLSPEHVLPADRGMRVRSLAQLELLQSIDAVERVRHLALGGGPTPDALLRALEARVPKVVAEPAVVPHRDPLRRLRAVARIVRASPFERLPYLIASASHPAMRRRVRARLRAEPYDVVYLGYLGMAAFLPDVRALAPCARVILEEHNVEHAIFERIARGARLASRWVWESEARALRRYEARVLRAVDAVIAISDDDARALAELGGREVIVVPPVALPPAWEGEGTTRPSLAFVGMLAWQPNALGLDWFCAHAWPAVRARVPDATLTIAGSGLRTGPDGAPIVPEGWKRPGITTVGFVDSLDAIYRDALALVAPSVGGSGVRLKLLEAMRAGVPVVTTPDGAAGLDVHDGRELLIARDPAAFADRVVELLRDAALRARLRASGLRYLEARHAAAPAREALAAALGLPA